MNHIRETLDALKTKKNEGSEEVIKSLIATDFSANDEEKGKAAEMLKGLFFSEEPEAKELIKKLDSWFSSMKSDVGEGEEEDSPLAKTMVLLQTKANAKSTADKAGIYQYLAAKLISLLEKNSALKMEARKLLLDMIKGGFKNSDI